MKKILCLFLFAAISARAYIPPAPQTLYWTTDVTNFFSLPGDSVSITAGGRNMATEASPVVFDLYFDTNDLFTTAEIAGNGKFWSLNSRLDWDGTNINWFAQFSTGDPSNSFLAFFGTITNAIVGTNEVTFAINENTNGLTMDSSSIVASRAPPVPSGDSFIPKGQNVHGNGVINYDPASTNSSSGVLQFLVTTNTPTIGDLLNQPGACYWVSNGVCWVTGSTNGTTLYTVKLAP